MCLLASSYPSIVLSVCKNLKAAEQISKKFDIREF